MAIGSEAIGDAYVTLRYRLDALTGDLARGQQIVKGQMSALQAEIAKPIAGTTQEVRAATDSIISWGGSISGIGPKVAAGMGPVKTALQEANAEARLAAAGLERIGPVAAKAGQQAASGLAPLATTAGQADAALKKLALGGTSLTPVASGANAAAASLERMGAAGATAGTEIAAGAKAGSGAMDLMKSAVVGVGAALGGLAVLALVQMVYKLASAAKDFVLSIGEVGNEMQVLGARLDNVLQVNNGLDLAKESANKLGVGISDVATAMARFGLAAADIGLGAKETQQFTENVLKLGRIGNSTATELSTGMTQLSQALASGKFQGDELRSVFESMPEFIRTLAKELGVTVGELRAMGTAGTLTADVILRAIGGATDEIDARFKSLPESLQQSEARMENDWKEMLAALDAAIGISGIEQGFLHMISSMAKGVTGLANLMRSTFGGMGKEEQIGFDTKSAQGQLAALQEQRTKLLDTVAAGKAQGSSGTLGTNQTAASSAIAQQDAAQAEAQLTQVDAAIGELNTRIAKKQTEAFAIAEERQNALQEMEQKQSLAKANKGGADLLPAMGSLSGLTGGTGSKTKTFAGDKGKQDYLDTFGGIAAEKQATDEDIAKDNERAAEAGLAAGKRIDAQNETRRNADIAARKKYEKEIEAAGEAGLAYGLKYDADMEAAGEAGLEASRRIEEQQLQVRMEAQEAQERFDAERKQNDPKGYFQDHKDDADLAPIYSFRAGAEKELQSYADAATEYGRMAGEGISAGLRGAEDALTQWALTGKIQVKDMLKEISTDLVRFMIRFGLQQAVGAALGGLGGGAPVQTTPGGTPGGNANYGAMRGAAFGNGAVLPMATGGITTGPTVMPMARGKALIGEAGEEGVLPLRRNKQGNLGVIAAGPGSGSGGPGMQVQIIDQRGAGAAPVVQERSKSSAGMEQLKVYIRDQVKATIGSGEANKPMANQFGLKPAVRA